jgi:glycerol-3-phosphate acyltransferase PlsY
MVWIEQLQSTNWVEVGRIGLGAYLLGCCTTGYYLVRWRTGQDIRESGSGSVGARNVGRILGAPGFILTLLGDFTKGAVAVWVAQHFSAYHQWLAAVAMLAVVAGHIWPAQLRLHGGKGMATSLGALCIFDFHLALAFGLLFSLGLFFVRKTIVPGLFAFACLPLVGACLGYNPGSAYDPAKVLSISILTSMVLFAHRKNVMEEIQHFHERRNFHPKQTPPEL